MDICVDENCASFAAVCANRVESYQRYDFWNWSDVYSPYFQLMKQRYDHDAANQYNRIGKFDEIFQTILLAHGQYLFSVAVLMAILLLLRRPNASNAKDDTTMYLFKDLISLLKLLHWKHCDYLNIIFTASCFLLFMALLPLLLTLWLFVWCYRQYIYYVIKKKYGDKFHGFLEGTDAVWALEDDSAKSVINIMAMVEIDSESADNGPVNVLLALRKRMALRFLGDYKPFPKLFWKRRKEHGYSFWTSENNCTIEDYIRFMPDIRLADNPQDTKKYVEGAFGIMCNMPLLCEHSASWEILVPKRHILDYNEEGELTAQIPVLFRIHHSLGDGVALLRLFLETIADREQPKKDLWAHCIRARQDLKTYLERDYSDCTIQPRTAIWKSLTSFDRSEFQKLWKRLKTFLHESGQKMLIFVTSPASIIHQGFFKKIDENSLHQKKLSGEKLVCWRFENDDDLDLLDTMKSIKRNFQGVRFSDVLLAALSISFQNYFESKGNHIPNEMTVVLPARIEAEGAQLKLQNKFSVALQTLPISVKKPMQNQAARFHSKMLDVKKYSDQLRSSPDYYVNFWIMSFLTALLPEHVLSSLTESVHSTIAVSNLPGPQTVTYINGHRINNMTFWLPHRGSTGIGISILSYGYKLQLGLIADRAVISNQNDAQAILDDTVNEIRRMAKRKICNLKRNSVGNVIYRL